MTILCLNNATDSCSADLATSLSPFIKYQTLSNDFSKFHQIPQNILLHLVTSPLGVFGVITLLRRLFNSTSLVAVLMLTYIFSLMPHLTLGSFFGTALICGFLLYVSRKTEIGTIPSIICIILGYFLQDISHQVTGEATFQGSYTKSDGQMDFTSEWFSAFVEHCYFLLPLCVHVALPLLKLPAPVFEYLSKPLPSMFQGLAIYSWVILPLAAIIYGSYSLDTKNRYCFFPGLPYFHRVIKCDLYETPEKDERRVDIRLIRDWVMRMSPSNLTSSHYWFRDLPTDVHSAFDRCANSKAISDMFRSLFSEKHYCLEVVDGMNEIYVTGPERFDEGPNSDQIFDMRHVDGPWGLIPFVSVYRCLIGMDKNYVVSTSCPLPNLGMNLTEGKVMGFDFNREVHYIVRDYSKQSISDDFRVTLKLHYCVYPRILAPLGWFMHMANVRYNKLFRALFLSTIQPVTPYEKFMAWNVTFNTTLMDLLETYVGQKNILYFNFVGLLWYLTGSYTVFLSLTSFAHYCRYITTYAFQKSGDVDFGSFKRDVLLMKTAALCQIGYHYFFPTTHPFEFDAISIFMIASGYLVSMLATNALGIDRTYFGSELGIVEAKWVDKFPYGYIPHPMIVSQIWALLGFYHAAHFRAEWPYLVPCHIVFYVVHMLQEQFNLHIPASYFHKRI